MAEEIHSHLTGVATLTAEVTDEAYVTLAQARAYTYQSQTADEPLLRQLIERASRIFDAACSLPDNYFIAGNPAQTASERYFWGDGTDFLSIDPHLSSYDPTAVMPTGFQTLGYTYVNPYQRARTYNGQEFQLVRTYGDSGSRVRALQERRDYFFAEFSNQIDYTGWPDGIRVGVTAKWGWDATPADVQEAVLEMIALMFRSRDQAFARAVAIDGNVVINSAMTPRAQMIADGYARGRAMFA
jgi:hypothetical protein